MADTAIGGGPRMSLFQPAMPDIDTVTQNQERIFATAWRQAHHAMMPQGRLAPGQRCVAVVTPGRLIQMIPAPQPGAVPPAQAESMVNLLPGHGMNVAAISYTEVRALIADPAKCIPFLGILLGLSYAGHNVVVFEGHKDALECGLKDANVLIVDSGMAPHLSRDWIAVALRVMSPGCRILRHDRITFRLVQIHPRAEPDGEASYANCLLVSLAKTPLWPVVCLAPGRPVPDLRQIAATDDERNWASGLPFRYDSLDPMKVASIVLNVARWPVADGGEGGMRRQEGRFRAQLATEAGQRQPVEFHLCVERDGANLRQLTIGRRA